MSNSMNFMCATLIVISFTENLTDSKAPSCGIDNSPILMVYEGKARIETYPWLGRLVYRFPIIRRWVTTPVVLITTQLVLTSANEIEIIPKIDFRDRARVVLGHNCSGPSIGLLEYNYHPDYGKHSYSALALVQLDTKKIKQKLVPICPPPKSIFSPSFYAMTMPDDCGSSAVRIHKMNYVDPAECRSYYRKSGVITVFEYLSVLRQLEKLLRALVTLLDLESIWPTHTACARARWGGDCIWRSGAVLMMRHGNRWSLVGFGVNGPGCQAPARFLDYGMYHRWVKTSASRIGQPAITRMGPDLLILRRSAQKIQRFGACDVFETKEELYYDRIRVNTNEKKDEENTGRLYRNVKYNITIYANIDYSCAVFSVKSDVELHDKYVKKPLISLRRWCKSTEPICYDSTSLMQMAFYIEIMFLNEVELKIRVYGKAFKSLDTKKTLNYINAQIGGLGKVMDIKDRASPKDAVDYE